VYVQEGIHDRFVQAAAEAAQRVRLGWSTGWDVDMGSLASVDQADRVEAHIRDAVDKGATVITGGRRRRDLGDAFVEPTILAGVEPGMDAALEETFGPVVSIHKVASAEEGLRLANDSEYGLNGSVWAGSRRRARELASRMQVGSAGINSTLLVYATLDAPMGGIRQSGLGRRHGAQGILRYTHARTIVRSVAWNGGYESIPRLVTSDRRARMLTGLFRVWRRIPGLR
jgi:acyl-CoA reductase-like NAD-dependent aldehyde dehydrogenase